MSGDMDALRAAVEELPAEPYFAASSDEGMCPNCLTPWRCNGPHTPPAREPAGYLVDRADVLRLMERIG